MRKILAAKVFPLALIGLCAAPSPVIAMPVFDATNLVQNTIAAKESVQQTIELVNQYQTQLKQYDNMLQNTAAPAAYIWDEAQSTINDLMRTIDTLDSLGNQVGGIDGYLRKFQDVDYYRNSPCFSASGCSDTERAQLEKNRRLGSESQKMANDAVLKGLLQQQDNLKADAKRLERLQSAAEGAKGQMEAIGYANQLSSQLANQLLQIRGLMIAQQNAIAARMQVEADREAQQQAADAIATEPRFKKTTNSKNWLELIR